MRCAEARFRIDRVTPGSTRPDNPALLNHLETCADCRAYAELSASFERVMRSAAVDDDVPGLGLGEQRRRVEARLKRRDRVVRPLVPSRPPAGRALGLSLGATAVVLALFALVPYTRYQTVGYDVSVDGTCMDVALNHERMCDLLGNLGLIEAGVDLIGCDTTCCVAILDLKTEHEARMVAGAISRLCEKTVTTSIVPIVSRSTGTLLERAGEWIRNDS